MVEQSQHTDDSKKNVEKKKSSIKFSEASYVRLIIAGLVFICMMSAIRGCNSYLDGRNKRPHVTNNNKVEYSLSVEKHDTVYFSFYGQKEDRKTNFRAIDGKGTIFTLIDQDNKGRTISSNGTGTGHKKVNFLNYTATGVYVTADNDAEIELILK